MLPQTFPPPLKPSPWTDSPRPGRDVALATEWGTGGIAVGDDGRGYFSVTLPYKTEKHPLKM